MKNHTILLLVFILAVNSQLFPPPSSSTPNTQQQYAATPSFNNPSNNVPPPNASLSFVANSMSDQAKINLSGGNSFTAAALPPNATTFNAANNVFAYMQKNLGGGCCSNCNKICGFAISIYNSSYYLTNMGQFLIFQQTTSIQPNHIFQLSQNFDCTWSILSNTGGYLSASSTFQGPWVGVSQTLGVNERWYIQRNTNYVEVQSASKQYSYWRGSSASPYYLGYSYGYSTRFVFQFYPCNVAYGWNW